MTNLCFDWQIEEYMVYCRSNQLREKTMNSYEQTLRLFERWCKEQMQIETVDKVTESVIRRYIADLQERGKYAFYADDARKETNFPDRRRDFRKPISPITMLNTFPYHPYHNSLLIVSQNMHFFAHRYCEKCRIVVI